MAKIDSFKYWMDQLAARSKSTRDMYQIYFNKFLEYAKATPDGLIEMQRKALETTGDPRENNVVEAKVRAWLAEMKNQKSPATRRMALAAVKSFFAVNLHPLKLTRLDRPQGESVGSRIPEKEEVVKIADAGKWKYRAAVMFLKDSGLRISDVVRVRWEDKVDMGDGFWNFNLVTEKRGVSACAFVGPETTRLLEQFKTKTGRIFNTSRDVMKNKLNILVKKARIEGVTAHGLRKYFVTSMEHQRVPKDYYLHMMGKKSSVYSEKRRSELFQAYKKAYPSLSLYAAREQTQELEKLKKQAEAQEKQLIELREMVQRLAQNQA